MTRAPAADDDGRGEAGDATPPDRPALLPEAGETGAAEVDPDVRRGVREGAEGANRRGAPAAEEDAEEDAGADARAVARGEAARREPEARLGVNDAGIAPSGDSAGADGVEDLGAASCRGVERRPDGLKLGGLEVIGAGSSSAAPACRPAEGRREPESMIGPVGWERRREPEGMKLGGIWDPAPSPCCTLCLP
ncbi:hypothetical protein CSQ85_03245 [Bifidobacterium rousetti]|nr:hypothetical protein [Bifidobacterium rousetti]KAA8819739.1 hypothetical protein CSQ85_03245 [Bifidobacterium rousetti]